MIDFIDVHKSFGIQEVLRGASFRVNPGERLGVVGPNGAGKSTLFSLITGDEQSDKGELVIPRNQRVGHLRQQLFGDEWDGSLLAFTLEARPDLKKIHDDIERIEQQLISNPADKTRLLDRLGVLQDQYEHEGGYRLDIDAQQALGGLGFSPADVTRPFRDFSGGWQMRAELARVLIARPDILLLDEPSNYLDLPAVEWLHRTLRNFDGTLLLITHDRYLLDQLTSGTLEVAGGIATRYPGGWEAYRQARASRREQAGAARKNQDKRKAEIERFVERFRAKSSKATQVQSRMKMLEKLEEVEVIDEVLQRPPIRFAEPPACGAEVLRLEEVGVTYDKESWILKGIDIRIERGLRIALVGFNGTGKTTLLRTMAGIRPPDAGRVVYGHHVVPGYQSQEFAETMPPDRSVYDLVEEVAPELGGKAIRSLLGSFGFGEEHIDKPCRVLSGGEKIRLAFARIFARPPNLLLLDEPTTHLDMDGRMALEEALKAYSGTVLFVSHDISFVRAVATQTIAMATPTIERYHGGYDYYLEKRATPTGSQEGGSAKTARPRKKETASERKERQSTLRKLEKRMRMAEQTLEKLDIEQTTLTEQLSAPSPDTDFAVLNQRLEDIRLSMEVEQEAWEKAGMTLEEMEAEHA